MAIIVKKFGGTSLGSGERMLNVARIVENTRLQHQVICVVSAMSGTVKEQGTTSQLLKAAELAGRHESVASPLKVIAGLHHQAILEAQLPEEVQQEVTAAIGDEIKRLRSFLRAITVIRKLSPRSTDALMSVGERLSARLLTAVLQGRGIPARFVDLTNVVPEAETAANSGFFNRLQERLGELCDPADGTEHGTVPVVTGFFGMVPGGLLKAVGRGYTDFTAALISAGLGKERVLEMQVWKEVDGILTADPRRVPNARLLPHITPTEAAELTYFGSEVLHPFTMERVVGAEVPIRIKNTFKPEGPGTEIRPAAGKDDWPVTAVTAKRGIVMATIHSNRMYDAHGFLARVFQVLEGHQVVVDLVSTSEVSISFTVNKVEEIERSLNDLKALGVVEFRPKRAILACVGEGMRDTPGMAGKMFSTLGQERINIEMISQGASEMNISCVIKEEDVERALQSVHKSFLELT